MSDGDNEIENGEEAEVEYLKCPCKECGNNVEYPPSSARTTITCPHCGEWTELAPADDDDEVQKSSVNILALALWIFLPIFVIAGLVVLIHHKSAEAELHPAKPPPQKVAVAVQKPPTIALPSNPAPVVVKQSATPIPEKTRPKSYTDLKILGNVKLEKSGEGDLKVAVGTLTNDSTYQRLSVVVEVDLLDAQTNKICTAMDQLHIMEPHTQWTFHAMVINCNPVAARIASLSEKD